MKTIFIILLSFQLGTMCFSQESYSSNIGAKLFPGHLHVVIDVDSTEIHYQLFNHWYSLSYAQTRDVRIPLSEIDKYGEQNDTLTILLFKNKVKLIDKQNDLKQTVKHQKPCTSVATMRKISYAVAIASQYDRMNHFHLYERSELDLSEDEFKQRVNQNLEQALKKE